MSLLFSLVDVVSEVIRGPSVVVVGRVVDVLAVGLVVGVLSDVEFGVIGEEQSVPGLVLFCLWVLFVTERLVVSLQHCALCHVQALLGDHGREGPEIGSWVPCILHLVAAQSVESEWKTSDETGSEEAASEHFSCIVTGIKVDKIVDEALWGNNGYPTLVLLCSSSHPYSKGSSEECTNNGVGPEGELVLILNFTLVLPCPPLGVGHILTEAECNPGIASVLMTQPIQNNNIVNKMAVILRNYNKNIK